MPKTIALVGNPNVGKSTLFNSLTGQNQKIINAPGTTVTVNKGWWQGNIVIDLPGLISFIHNSVDEKVAVDALLNKNNVLNPDLIILVADAMHISRSLYLLAQLKQLNIPIVLVVTMADIARKRQMDLDVEKISKILKLPTILIDSREAKGIKDLESLIYKIGRNLDTNKTKILFDSKKFIAETKNNFETNIKWVADIEKKLSISNIDKLTLSDRIDKVLLNKFFGSVFFLIILFLVFQFSTYISFPIIDFIDGPARNFITDNFSLLFSTGVWQNFVLSTIIATIFTLLEFVSPILFIFIALAILENCGYLARAALVSDKLMRGIGLEGNSILPIIIGFGCNLPAIKATRILKTSQIRRQTAF
ncbi:MAG: 50S ribosome-binding GTPase, partial [Bifidobacteriaceae bacterium]|nr:50S ribosome-binding GTPase [Bifidobacteriaceae bacterium]